MSTGFSNFMIVNPVTPRPALRRVEVSAVDRDYYQYHLATRFTRRFDICPPATLIGPSTTSFFCSRVSWGIK
jgi:hypothetical protein